MNDCQTLRPLTAKTDHSWAARKEGHDLMGRILPIAKNNVLFLKAPVCHGASPQSPECWTSHAQADATSFTADEIRKWFQTITSEKNLGPLLYSKRLLIYICFRKDCALVRNIFWKAFISSSFISRTEGDAPHIADQTKGAQTLPFAGLHSAGFFGTVPFSLNKLCYTCFSSDYIN